MFRRVYLDNSATTQVDTAVVEAMLPYLTDVYGNASSIHYFGQQARAAVDKARHQVAQLLNSRPNEVIFTSGGTESNNLAIRGLCLANQHYGKHMIISAIEHPAVESVCEDLEKDGFETTRLPVYKNGIVRINDIEDAIRDDTILISVMAANNEIGTLQPVEEIGKLVKSRRSSGQKIWFHTDAVQAVGKVVVDVEAMGCDLLSISGHKIHAPKGVGALYVRRGTRLRSQNIGGRQERGIRAGTESVPNIVALGTAAELTIQDVSLLNGRVKGQRDRLERQILEQIPDSQVNGDLDLRLPNITNISFADVEGEALLINLDMHGIAVSTGSACSSGSIEPSPVIKALGVSDTHARSAIRFSLGRFNTDDDVSRVLDILPVAIENIRSLSK